MVDYEKLGAFYLGRTYDDASGKILDELLLYDSKDLTTHAVCVGMTGSGKTGLCIGLLEEAAIDGIPALVIDPKGDLGNLLLTFPELRAEDFLPWIDPGEASRKGATPAEYAGQIAGIWKKGLADWGQDGSRIAKLRDTVELAIYTPGSRAGRPLAVLGSFDAPPEGTDDDALRDRVETASASLLALVGIDGDLMQSREHILLTNLLDTAWRAGKSLDLAAMIGQIQSPPFQKLGVLELESFFPAKDRFALAMRLNGLLASQGFAAWMEGEPLDIARLLYTPEGKPRIAILSIAHLSDAERMFFVTQLLNEFVSWMRRQPGTPSLRALLYMDEVFGYFPPTANPPSKRPMLTLLKQARAFGVGVVLATQNPVDLDYKGLSNTGTWFLGRLQTERDKARVLDGLEGASTRPGGFDRARLDRVLSGLSSRVFLMHNVHDDHPVLFHTRWVMSYLRGPLTRDQIRTLASQNAPEAQSTAPPAETSAADASAADRPVVSPDVDERFIASTRPGAGDGRLVYRPALLGAAQLHYADRSSGVDFWRTERRLAFLRGEGGDPWRGAEGLDEAPELDAAPEPEAKFSALPAGAGSSKAHKTFRKQLSSSLYRDVPLELLHSKRFKKYSEPGQDPGEFTAEVRQLAREKRDLEVEKLRKRFAAKLKRVQDKIATAQGRVEREQSQRKQQRLSTLVSVGATVLGALFGRRATSSGTVGRAATAMRSAGRASRESGDVARARERVETLNDELQELEADFEEKSAALVEKLEAHELDVKPRLVRPRKSDIQIDRLSLVWTPWWVSPEGIAERAF